MPTKTDTVALISRDVTRKKLTSGTPPVVGYDQTLPNVYFSSFANSRTGVSLPRWHSIIKSGGNATTAMSGTRVRRLSYQPMAGANGWNAVHGDNSTYFESYVGLTGFANQVPSHVSGTSESSADNQALTQAYGRLLQMRSQFQGLVALGELPETLRMLKSPFRGLRDALSAHFKNLKLASKSSGVTRTLTPARSKKFRQVAGETWLETVFGIRPLISDIEDGLKAVARFHNDSRREVIVGYGSSSVGTSGTATSGAPNTNYLLVKTSWIDRTTRTVRYKVYVDHTYSAEFGSTERALQLSGVSLEQFVPAMYELIPWSFFADYFSNLGHVIQAGCTSQQGVKFVVKTSRLETVRTASSSVSGQRNVPWAWGGVNVPGESVISRSDVQRSASGLLGQPSLEVYLPGKPMQWANTLALLASDAFKMTGTHQRGIRF